MTVGVRALVTAATMPIVALAMWATGGATSFIQPVMIFTALFISYLFPPRLAWPLNLLFVYAFATPLLYDDRALEVGYPARLVMFALAVAGTTVAIQFLKGRLVRAELHQRSMAERDPLTGVSNRRAFDAALVNAASTGEPYALILIDLDDFKRVNDEQGHPAGDEVLCSVAVAASTIARKGDCVARIGGDEFARPGRGRLRGTAPAARPARRHRPPRHLRGGARPGRRAHPRGAGGARRRAPDGTEARRQAGPADPQRARRAVGRENDGTEGGPPSSDPVYRA
jgi:Diguanylate cyclase, GGDEF domain